MGSYSAPIGSAFDPKYSSLKKEIDFSHLGRVLFKVAN